MPNKRALLQCPTCGEIHEVSVEAIENMVIIACPHCMKAVSKDKFRIYHIPDEDTVDDDFYGI